MDPDSSHNIMLMLSTGAAEQAVQSGNAFSKLLILVCLILINAFFAMSEIAVLSLNDAKVSKQAEEGNKKAKTIKRLIEEPSKFLATIQVGVTLAGLLSSAVAADSFTEIVVQWFSGVNISPSLVRGVSLVIITVLLSYFTLVFGELVPKRIAMQYPEKVAFGVSGMLMLLYRIGKPFVALLAASTNIVARMFGVSGDDDKNNVTEEEIRMMVDVGEEKGVIEESAKDMINNVFDFDDKTVADIMTHRIDIAACDTTSTMEDITETAIEQGYSRIPVYDGTIDDIVGIVYVKDLLRLLDGNNTEMFELKNFIRPVLYVPESNSCRELFLLLNQKKIHMAVVVDEYGGTSGLVTMEDIIESIVGNIQDEYDDEEEEISKIDDDTYSIDGAAALDDVIELLEFSPFDDESEEPDYDTLGGLVLDLLGYIPNDDEHPTVSVDGVEFTVEKAEERRILRVRAHKLPKPQADEDAEEKE